MEFPHDPKSKKTNHARRLTYLFILLWFLWAVWLSNSTLPQQGSLLLLAYKVVTFIIWISILICATWAFLDYLRNEFYRFAGRPVPPTRPGKLIHVSNPNPYADPGPHPYDYFIAFDDGEFIRKS